MLHGLSLFIPMLRIRFFITPGPKIPHSRFGTGSESGTFGQGRYGEKIITQSRYRRLSGRRTYLGARLKNDLSRREDEKRHMSVRIFSSNCGVVALRRARAAYAVPSILTAY